MQLGPGLWGDALAEDPWRQAHLGPFGGCKDDQLTLVMNAVGDEQLSSYISGDFNTYNKPK